MGENSKIEWTDHTFNPWIGCTKVHQGCTNCYAEADFDKRKHFANWGPNGTRVMTSPANWAKPIKWNREAAAAGVRAKVFCASLCDVFEDWKGNISSSQSITDEACPENGFEETKWNPVLWHRDDIGICTAGQTTVPNMRGERLATMDDLRRRLFALIDATPNLDWLLLTKRPENIRRMWPYVPHTVLQTPEHQFSGFRQNVWLGTSISDQASADKQIPELLKCRDLSPVLFLSCEPLLGAVRLDQVQHDGVVEIDCLRGRYGLNRPLQGNTTHIDWVICGGESGHNARPMHPDWARGLRDQCHAAGVLFLFKQWGEWASPDQVERGVPISAMKSMTALLPDGREIGGAEPIPKGQGVSILANVGKHTAGRLLDGREWNEFPEPVPVS